MLPPNTEPILPELEEKPNTATPTFLENPVEANTERLREQSNLDDKSFTMDKEMEAFLLSSFDKMNQDFFRVDPLLVPLVPATDQKILELEI